MTNPSERGAFVQNQEILSQKEKIDDDMGNLLAAIGNNEAKAVTLLVMNGLTLYTPSEIHTAFMRSQGKNPGWNTDKNLQFDYCARSLAPIGLVTYEIMDVGNDRQTHAYMITPYGNDIGKPLAALLLDFSRRYPMFSLNDFFGNTASNSKSKDGESDGTRIKRRSPQERLEIFWELATVNLPIRQTDLAKRTKNEENSIAYHLVTLLHKNIISYESIEQGKSFSYYRLNPDAPQQDPSPYEEHPSLTKAVFGILKSNPEREWSVEEIANEYTKLLTATDQAPKSIKGEIARVLSHLRKQQYATIKRFDSTTQSEVALSEQQRNAIVDLLTIIDAFQNRDPEILEKGKALAQEFISSPHEITKLMQKAKEHSGSVNIMSQEQCAAFILNVVSANPDMGSRGICEALNSQNMNLSGSKIRELLRYLVETEQLRFTEKHGVREYRDFNVSDN